MHLNTRWCYFDLGAAKIVQLTFDIYHQPLSNVHSVRATTTEKDPASWNFNPKVIWANTIWYKVTLKPCFKFSDTA